MLANRQGRLVLLCDRNQGVVRFADNVFIGGGVVDSVLRRRADQAAKQSTTDRTDCSSKTAAGYLRAQNATGRGACHGTRGACSADADLAHADNHTWVDLVGLLDRGAVIGVWRVTGCTAAYCNEHDGRQAKCDEPVQELSSMQNARF